MSIHTQPLTDRENAIISAVWKVSARGVAMTDDLTALEAVGVDITPYFRHLVPSPDPRTAVAEGQVDTWTLVAALQLWAQAHQSTRLPSQLHDITNTTRAKLRALHNRLLRPTP